MFSRKQSKNAMKVVRNEVRKLNKAYAQENCPVKLEIYKWNMKSGSVLVIGYRTDRPRPELCDMAMNWVGPNVFMNSHLYDIAYKAYNQC